MAEKTENRKAIIIRVEPDFHQKLKVYAALNSTTIQDYVLNLVKADIEQKEGAK